MMMIKGKNI